MARSKYYKIINIPKKRCVEEAGSAQCTAANLGPEMKVFCCQDKNLPQGRNEVVQRWEIDKQLVTVLKKKVRDIGPIFTLGPAKGKRRTLAGRLLDRVKTEKDSPRNRIHGSIVQVPRYRDESWFIRVSERTV